MGRPEGHLGEALRATAPPSASDDCTGATGWWACANASRFRWMAGCGAAAFGNPPVSFGTWTRGADRRRAPSPVETLPAKSAALRVTTTGLIFVDPDETWASLDRTRIRKQPMWIMAG